MFAVTNHRRGTAYRSRIAQQEMRMAGKTGSRQVRSELVDNDKAPYEQRAHALFVGYAPYDNPKYAVSVVVKHGGSGSKTAAPIARDLMLHALYGGAPPLDAYPSGSRSQAQQIHQDLDLKDFGNTRSKEPNEA